MASIADQVLDLSEIKDPVFEVRLPDATTRSYDPFKLGDAIDAATKDAGQLSDGDMADRVRGAMGFPNETKAAELGAFTPSIYQVLTIIGRLKEFREGLDVIKKLGGPTPS